MQKKILIYTAFLFLVFQFLCPAYAAVPVSGSEYKEKLPAPVITGVYNSAKGGDIRWTKVQGATGYIVYRFRAAEKMKKVIEIDDPEFNQWYDTSITNHCWGRVYHYYVASKKGKAEGNRSKPAILQRVAPMRLALSYQGTGIVKASWLPMEGSGNKANGYEIQYAESKGDLFNRNGTWRSIQIRSRSSLSREIDGFADGRWYYFRMRAYCDYTHSVTGATARTWSQYSEVIKIRPEEPAVWEVTQYVDASGSQGMFYSVRSLKDGRLIIIDGGNPGNADQVRIVIEKLGGHVDMWFLTHYHMDHIGAFNRLWEEYRGRINRVYITPMDRDTYQARAHEWDKPEYFAEFLNKVSGASNIFKVHRGDVIAVDGLEITILNAFDENVMQYSTDWCNDCSLVIRMKGRTNSMLFLGDLSRTGVRLGNYILKRFGVENVRADYVQAGHHGNRGLPVSFYEKLHLREMFFDAPAWLMTGEMYDAKDLEAWCMRNGIAVHDYRKGGHSIILR